MPKPINPEYAALVEFEILRPGPLNWFEVTPEIMREVVASYDVDVLRAPLVLDHMEAGPAYGHILDLELRDDPNDHGELVVIGIAGVFETGLQLIQSGAWPERSIMMSRWHPFDGIWYLNHLSLLGAANPAVVEMGPVIILDDEDEFKAGANVPDAIAASAKGRRWAADEDFIRYRIRSASRFRDPEKFKEEAIDEGKGIFQIVGKLKSSYLPEGANTNDIFVHAILFSSKKWDLSRAKKWIGSNEKKFSREGARTVMAENGNENVDTVTAEEIAAKQKEIDERERVIAERENEVAKERAEIERNSIAAKVEALRVAGKILPAQIELNPVEIAMSIPAGSMIGDVSARDVFFEFIEAGNITAPVKGEVAKGNGADTRSTGSNYKVGADPEIAKAKGIKIVDGSDVVLARMNELIAEGKNSRDALLQAQKEHREGVIS